MARLNQCNFIGHVGKKPEIKMYGSGNKLATFSMAVTDKYKDKSGEYQEKTTWINLTAFSNNVNVVENYIDKGSKIYASCKYDLEEYEKDGEKKKYPKFIIQRIILLDRKDNTSQENNNTQSSFVDDIDDIPF